MSLTADKCDHRYSNDVPFSEFLSGEDHFERIFFDEDDFVVIVCNRTNKSWLEKDWLLHRIRRIGEWFRRMKLPLFAPWGVSTAKSARTAVTSSILWGVRVVFFGSLEFVDVGVIDSLRCAFDSLSLTHRVEMGWLKRLSVPSIQKGLVDFIYFATDTSCSKF